MTVTTGVTVDLGTSVPVYEQIRGQVAALVAVGALGPGDRLPASRDLARDLGIAVGTVQRAYRELESSGIVVGRRRVGTVVAERPTTRPTADDALVTTARHLAAAAREAGLDDDAVIDLVRGALRTT